MGDALPKATLPSATKLIEDCKSYECVVKSLPAFSVGVTCASNRDCQDAMQAGKLEVNEQSQTAREGLDKLKLQPFFRRRALTKRSTEGGGKEKNCARSDARGTRESRKRLRGKGRAGLKSHPLLGCEKNFKGEASFSEKNIIIAVLSTAVKKALSQKQRGHLEKMGVELLSDNDEIRALNATHVIVPKEELPRTLRVMCAICRGQHVVHSRWLRSCLREGKCVDEAGHEPQASCQQLTQALGLARSRPLLDNRSVYVFPSIPQRTALQMITRAAGGKVLSKRPTSAQNLDQGVLLIGTINDLRAAGACKLHTPELLFEAAMTQQLREECHRV